MALTARITPELSKGFMALMARATNFLDAGSRRSECSHFLIDEYRVGFLTPDVLDSLNEWNLIDVTLSKNSTKRPDVRLKWMSVSERSRTFAEMLASWRKEGGFPALKGWRDELFDLWVDGRQLSLMTYERSAAAIFGLTTYGVHINGYVNDPVKGGCMWVGRRSPTKQTYPGMLDQIVAGGLASGLTLMECCAKECQEEACMPDHLIANLRPAGTVSLFYEDERGICPECEYVYDVELPLDYQPRCQDGEMQEFLLLTYQQVLERVAGGEFKLNCALVCLDFLIRHGVISPHQEPNYNYLVAALHTKLPNN